MAKYKHVTYKTGCAFKVTPEDRAIDVMSYLITGHLFCGRSLDGVTIELVEDEWLKKKASGLTYTMNQCIKVEGGE